MTDESDTARIDLERRQVDQRWGQLHGLEQKYAQIGLRFIFLSNAGGAIATLSFIGASTKAAELPLVRLTLVTFVIGLVLYGITAVFLYFRVLNLFNKYQIDAGKYLRSEMSFDDLNKSDYDRTVNNQWIDYALPIISFCCFLVGCTIGAMALFP